MQVSKEFDANKFPTAVMYISSDQSTLSIDNIGYFYVRTSWF